jgi:hypothetical protein
VVRALADDDPLTPAEIATLLGRGRSWVDRRLTLGRRLVSALAGHVDDGRLSATTAHTLAALPRGEQPCLADAITRHGLRTRPANAFFTAWRVAGDAACRQALLRDPHGAVPAPRDPAVSPLCVTACTLQARFDQTERALAELLSLDLTGFADPDGRVLEACQGAPGRAGRPAGPLRPGGPPPNMLTPEEKYHPRLGAQGLNEPPGGRYRAGSRRGGLLAQGGTAQPPPARLLEALEGAAGLALSRA